MRPEVTELSDKRWAIDYGAPGPYLTLSARQVRGLVFALADAGWIHVDGQPLRPRS